MNKNFSKLKLPNLPKIAHSSTQSTNQQDQQKNIIKEVKNFENRMKKICRECFNQKKIDNIQIRGQWLRYTLRNNISMTLIIFFPNFYLFQISLASLICNYLIIIALFRLQQISIIFLINCLPFSALSTMKESVTKQQTILDYEIMNPLCGQGNIKTIRQDNGFWRSYIGAETTRIKCKFKNICSPVYIQLKILNASLLDVTCYYNNEEESNELIYFSGKQRSSKQKLYYQFKKLIKEVDEISLDLHSYNKKQVEIIMIRFYGKIVRKRPVSKTQQNPENGKDVKKKIIQETFNDRVKSNEKKEKQQYAQKQGVKQKIQNSQRKQQLQGKKLSQLGLHLPQNYDKDQLLEQDEFQVQKDYKTSFVSEQQINRVMNVNEKWLECQRKLQASFGVNIQHKLSVLLNPKYFHGMKFCIANIYGQEKSKYVKMIKELGGLVREDPSQNCIVVASNPKGNLIGMARLMAGTKIMKLNYIDDCYKKKQKLKFKSYQFGPEDYVI